MFKERLGFRINENLVIHSYLELSKTLLFYIDDYKKAFKDEDFFNFLLKLDPYRTLTLRRLLKTERNFISFCYKLTYYINPYLPFVFKSKRIENFKEITNYALENCPNTDETILILLENKIFSLYLKNKEKENSSLFKIINKIEDDYVKDKYLAYYEFSFLYTDDKEFIYEGYKFKDIESFINIYMKSEKGRNYLIKNFTRDYNYYLVYLFKFNKEDIIKDFENLLILSEEYNSNIN